MTTEEALNALLGQRRTGDQHADLISAAKEAMRRRGQNTADGGLSSRHWWPRA